MEKIKVFVAHSGAAQEAVEVSGSTFLLSKKFTSFRGVPIANGYDYAVYEFDTDTEANAFIKGMETQSGWVNDPYWEKIK